MSGLALRSPSRAPSSSVRTDDDILGLLYGSVTREDALATMLAALASRYGCPAAALVYLDDARPAANVVMGHGLIDERALELYRTTYAALDPAPAAMAQLRIGEVTATDRLFGDRKPEYRRFLEEFYLPLGLVETLGGPIADEDGRSGIIGIQRGPDRPPFSDAELADLSRLVPHIASALKLRRAFFELECEARGLTEAVEPIKAGLMIFGPDGIVQHANLAARRILDRADALKLDRKGRLRSADPALQATFDRFFAGTTDEGPAVLRVERAGGLPPYGIRVWTRTTWAAGDACRSVRIVISDPDHVDQDAVPILREVLDLSHSGARLVAGLLDGDSLQSYATRHAMSLNTVKAHLKAAFLQTGTRRQSDLVRLAGAIVRDLAA